MLLSPAIISPARFRPVPATGGGGSDPDIANVILLAGFEGAFTDESPSAHSFVTNGTPTTTGTPKFGTGAFQSTANTNFVEYAIDADFNLANSQDWTVEFFGRMPTVTTNVGFIQMRDSGDNIGQQFYYFGSNQWGYNPIGGTAVGTGFTASNGVYNHVAFVNDGGTTTIEIFVDGVSQVSANNDFTDTGSLKCLIGTVGGGASGTKELDEVRITKNVKRYTANFTPPASPFPRS